MSLEKEFTDLCHRFFDLPQIDKTPEKISQFFSRLIQENQKVVITEEIRYFIPLLATFGNGLFSTMLDPCIEGLSPMHYVPDLQITSNNTTLVQSPRTPKSCRSFRNPRNRQNDRCQTARAPRTKISDLNPGAQLTLPHQRSNMVQTARQLPFSKRVSQRSYRPVLPPLTQTQDDVLHSLYVRDTPKFFTGKVMQPKSLDINIMPPEFPTYMIGNQFDILSATGVIQVDGNKSNATPLSQFVLNQTHEFMVKQIFNNNHMYKCFFIWHEMFRERRFRKIVNSVDVLNEVSRPLFNQLIDEIRETIILFTDDMSIFYPDFDSGISEVKFSEFQQVSNEAIIKMEEIIIKLATDTETILSNFFRQIRATNLQMQLDFEELHSMNLLPESLKEYSGDLKWRFPSLSRDRERNALLRHERKVAFMRQNYLGKFFTRVRGVYNGTLVMQCLKCMTKFLNRFSSTFLGKRRMNKIYANFDLENGITIEPSYEEFGKWVNGTIADIKFAFLLANKQMKTEIISEVDPEYECQNEDPMVIFDRFPGPKFLEINALEEIKDSFDFFIEKTVGVALFMKELKKQVEYSKVFTDFRNFEELQNIINGFLESENHLKTMPRNIFHKLIGNDEVIDFVLEMRPSIEDALKYLNDAMNDIKKRAINELNNRLFNEIQEKWASVKDKRITREESHYLETRLVLYGVITDELITAWKDLIGDVKGSFDTLINVYRALNEKSFFTHVAALESFNSAADKVGITGVAFSEDQEYEEEEETEEEEVVGKVHRQKRKRTNRRSRSDGAPRTTFADSAAQTMTEEEEIAENEKYEKKET